MSSVLLPRAESTLMRTYLEESPGVGRSSVLEPRWRRRRCGAEGRQVENIGTKTLYILLYHYDSNVYFALRSAS